MNKPIIGLTCSREMFTNQEIQFIHQDYIDAIMSSGGIPVLLPICEKTNIIQQVSLIDGLLITGGIDINPLFYNENCHRLQGESDAKRDAYEIALIKETASRHIPILGICRGIQVINVAFKGTLYQDNSLINQDILQHEQKERKEFPIHRIDIEKDTFLSSIFHENVYVNSFHHQSIHKLADNFKVVARSEDGIIEAIEHISLPIYAMQFHPEKMVYTDPRIQRIFDEFVKTCL